MPNITCNRCGNECKENDKFCSSCGELLIKKTGSQKEESIIEETNMPDKNEVEIHFSNNLDEMGTIYNWLFGIVFAFLAFGLFVHLFIICGIIFSAIATILIPPSKTYIENKFNINISLAYKSITIIIGFVLVLTRWCII